ncbi:MAG: division/cell wall cluster transcriptional repressor MraZ [Deltaproteobacteria bacterium]|nr:division/cell wall cluster transcriptional repressor MraZ [Deltaproteobacteria bacterium]
MFRGEFEHAIDPKGRTSLPASFREQLSTGGSDRLVATAGLDACLLLYPLQAWEELERKLAALPSMDQRVRTVKRALIGRAHEISADRHGRILIPPPLRSYAGFEREIVFVGQLSFIELWARDKWTPDAQSFDPAEVQAAIADLDLEI